MIYETVNYTKGFGYTAGTFKTAKLAKEAREFTATAKQMSAKHGRRWQELNHDHSEVLAYSSLRAYKAGAMPVRVSITFKL